VGVTFQCLCLTTQYYLTTNQTCISLGTYGDACTAGGRPCEARDGMKPFQIFINIEKIIFFFK
jgi:hypothetical protein